MASVKRAWVVHPDGIRRRDIRLIAVHAFVIRKSVQRMASVLFIDAACVLVYFSLTLFQFGRQLQLDKVSLTMLRHGQRFVLLTSFTRRGSGN